MILTICACTGQCFKDAAQRFREEEVPELLGSSSAATVVPEIAAPQAAEASGAVLGVLVSGIHHAAQADIDAL